MRTSPKDSSGRPRRGSRAATGIMAAALLLLVSCGKPDQVMSAGGSPGNPAADPSCAPRGTGTTPVTTTPATSTTTRSSTTTGSSTTTTVAPPRGTDERPIPLGSPTNDFLDSLPGPAPSTTAPGTIPGSTPATATSTTGPNRRDPCVPSPPGTATQGTSIAGGTTPGTTVADPTPRASSPAGSDPTTTVYAGAAGDLTVGGAGAVVGNDIDGARCPQFQPTSTAPCGPQPMYWAAINGPFADFRNGDPYATRCNARAQGGSSSAAADPECAAEANPLYRSSGYAFAIDVAPDDVGRPLTLTAYDIGVYERKVTSTSGSSQTSRGGTPPPAPDCRTGAAPFTDGAMDRSFTYQSCQTGDFGKAQNFDLEVFDSGGPSGDVRFDRSLPSCHLQRSAAELAADATTYKNRWVEVCTITPSQIGVYALRVRNSGLPDLPDAGEGINAYALKVTGGRGTRVYPVGEQSVYMNGGGETAMLPLAGVPSKFAGRTMVIDGYDPGDGSSVAPFTLAVVPPDASQPYGAPGGPRPECTFNRTPSATFGPAAPDPATGCQVTTKAGGESGGLYNGKWLRIEVHLDPGYACTGSCFWYLQYNFGSAALPTDRTVWSVHIA